MLGAGVGKLLWDGRGSSAAHGQEQAALGAKPLDERGRDDASFFRDVSERELRGAAALHHTRGGGLDLFVGGFAGARAHVRGEPGWGAARAASRL